MAFKHSPDNFWGRSGLWSLWRYLFTGRNLIQVVIGLPLAAYIFWRSPYWIHYVDPQAGVLGMDMYLPALFAITLILVFNTVSRIGAGLNNEQFRTEAIRGCDNAFLLYLLYFCSLVLLTGLIAGGMMGVR